MTFSLVSQFVLVDLKEGPEIPILDLFLRDRDLKGQYTRFHKGETSPIKCNPMIMNVCFLEPEYIRGRMEKNKVDC